MRVINPATEEVIAEVPEDDAASAAAKLALARAAQPTWRALAVEERIARIARFDRLLDEERELLARTLSSEMGKPLAESFNELAGARARIRYFLDHSRRWLEDEWVDRDSATREKISYEPLGVIGSISAWNYPYLVGVNVFVPALIGGNAVLYKPSELATLTGLHIQRLLYAADVPAGCFQAVVGAGTAGALLLELDLDGYFFTGSYRTGRRIAERVAGKLVPCQLELGGKDPLYVMDDVADIEQAAASAVEGVTYNCGQSCCAVERVYVQETIFDRFVAAFAARMRALVVGDPLDPKTTLGPLARKEQQQFLLSQIEDAVAKGAKVLCGGKLPARRGYFMEPTVLVNVNHGMRVMTEESFGPVVGVQAVRDDREAASLMQDTEYGLTGAVFSTSFERAEKVLLQLSTGTVYWNCCDRVSASLPWSGRKHSGIGSTLSYQGIRAFVQPKAWHIRSC